MLKGSERDVAALTREFMAGFAMEDDARKPDAVLKTDAFGEARETETWAADVLVEAFGDELRYVPAWRSWLRWTGQRWQRDDAIIRQRAAQTARIIFEWAARLEDTDRRARFVRFALRLEDKAKLDAVAALAGDRESVRVTPQDLDADAYLINTPSGTLNLKTGKLQEHSPADLITKVTRGKYSPGSKCPTWIRFLHRSMGGPDVKPDERVNVALRVKFLQRAAGVALSGDVSDKAVFVLHGPKDAGKTRFLEALKYALGDYAGQVLIESLIANGKQSDANSQADLADLQGLRFVSTSEAEGSQMLAEGRLKYLTQGKSTIKVCRKYENPFMFPATHKLFLDCNELPRIKTSDDSVWDRLRPIPFAFRVPSEEIDPELPQKLEAEADGIIMWALEGFQRWQADGLGSLPDVDEARQAWRAENDPLSEFIEECCDTSDARALISASDLWDAYVAWAAGAGERFPLKRRTFGLRLQARGFTDSREYLDGQTRRVWRGLDLR